MNTLPGARTLNHQQSRRIDRRASGVVGAVVAAITTVTLGGCSGGDDAAAEDSPTTSETEVTIDVEFEVSGTGVATNVSFLYFDGVREDHDGPLPFEASRTVTHDPFLDGTYDATIHAALDQAGGEITCRILFDGKVVDERTSDGDFAAVDCKAPLPEN